ncbi:septal ring lytic transglycosylase RlpA family protein [Pusillimonas sp.]|uniref:septal ring lytic transglycosylase RlpA family protein n=1 Tax=Pusillimonas sp. TaxID=3040095 RepID=UPI0037C7C710
MSRVRAPAALMSLCAALVLAGCGSTGHKGGGYYKDDGPGANIPANILNTPDAVPRIESYAPANMRPYRVLGRNYVPITSGKPFRQTGVASWYGKKFHGRKTANGETYDMYAMSAAHPTLPLPSYARVTRPDTGKTVVVRINDRGPFHSGRVIDLSYTAAAKLGLIGSGSGKVVVEAITHTEIAQAQAGKTHTALANQGSGLTTQPNQPAPAESSETMAVDLNNAVAVKLENDTTNVVPDALAVLDGQAGTPVFTTQAAYDASPNDTATPAPTLEDDGNSGIFLQFGAFSGQVNAESLADQLNKQIALVESRRAQVIASSDLYRVRIGPYSSRTEAVNAALRIQEQTGARATVATRD